MQRRTNTPTANVYVNKAEIDAAMMKLPEDLRRWLEYECSENINAVQLVEVHDAGLRTWYEIWNDVRNMSEKGHHRDFGAQPGELRRSYDRRLQDQIDKMFGQEGRMFKDSQDFWAWKP